jgi:nucleotide-binding universal stress UspA family protein
MKILLALDKSRQAKSAKRFLQQISFSGKTDLYLAHVIEPPYAPLKRSSKITPRLKQEMEALQIHLKQDAEQLLSKEQASFSSSQWTCHPLILQGLPGAEILNAVKKTHPELVVVGTRGLSGLQRFLLGSVSEWILTDAPCSVLVVRGSHRATHKKSKRLRILLATDGSSDAQAARDWVHSLNLPPSSHITVLHVVRKHRYQTEQLITATNVGSLDFPRLAEKLLQERGREGAKLIKTTIGQLKHPGLKITEALAFGHEADEILKAAKRTRANLVVLGSRGLTGLRKFLLGSVSQTVARHAPCSVLVVRLPGSSKR